MYLFITIVILIASIFLILIVLVQNSKGGGLSSGFSSSNQVMGVRKTTDFVEKATWTLAGVVLLLSIVAAAFIPKEGAQESLISNEIEATPAIEVPSFETPVVEEGAIEMTAPESAE